ncbi:MAG: hypothetical protein JXB34_12455 [Bacteroidales bacterium]|nr:hypothetical protein [Bacteroidales bacterium]
MTLKKLFVIAVLACSALCSYSVDKPKFKLGIGGGINFTKIADKNTYPLYEAVANTPYSSEFSGMGANLGNQFFVHGGLVFNKLTLGLRPGLYTYKFKKTDALSFSSGDSLFNSGFLARYLNTPFDIKWKIGPGRDHLFIGAGFSYAYLLTRGGNAGNALRGPRFSAGPLWGLNFHRKKFDIVFTSGFDFGLNQASATNSIYTPDGANYLSPGKIKMHNLHFSLSLLFAIEKSGFRKSLECPKIQR